MLRGTCLGVFYFSFMCSVSGLFMTAQRRDTEDDHKVSRAILEMLHISKVSTSHQAKLHPYMRRIHQHLASLEVQDFGKSDGMLVQSFRSVDGPHHAPQGWIWFDVSSLSSSMVIAELVLFRKNLHPHPLSVIVTLHSVITSQKKTNETCVLEERQLGLDQRPSSGYDVFNVSALLAVRSLNVVGFELRYKDETGSLVLHEALTQSLYCLNRGCVNEPILVFYQDHPLQH